MKQFSFSLTSCDDLAQLLADEELNRSACHSSAMLVQVFSASQDPQWLTRVADAIRSRFPNAEVVGASTVGEIHHGQTLTGATVVAISLFDYSRVDTLYLPCGRGQESHTGRELRQLLGNREGIAGVLLLATSVAFDANALVGELNRPHLPYPVFGGGAADYGRVSRSLLLHNGHCVDSGVVAVLFSGDELHIDCHTYLGWRPLSKPMVATEVKKFSLKLLDNRPAYEVFSRYLNIANDENFYLNALEFPLMVERDGQMLARVPVGVGKDRSIEFIADIRQGEQVRLGYGDPRLILRDAHQVHEKMAPFAPQALFLYSCGCRRYLMQEQVEQETLPFQQLAPTVGFYTYGEFYGDNGDLRLLNSTMVAVGLREGPANSDATATTLAPAMHDNGQAADDPYANQHIRIIERLEHFIDVVTSELQQASSELEEQAVIDKLTQLPNHCQLEGMLAQEILNEERFDRPFSVILLDIDNLEQINGRHGRLIGDEVVRETAQLMSTHMRRTDQMGRWEGGTFMVILPDTSLNEARLAAVKLYAMFGQTHFTHGEHCTASLGVVQYPPGYALGQMVSRARQALYRAKRAGGDQVYTLN